MDISHPPSRAEFKVALKDALTGLYDPGMLASSHLITWFGLRGHVDPTHDLLNLLLQAIESRQPGPDVPPRSNAWRVYHILRQRYVECFDQQDIAANLVLSTRQLRRLHVTALDVLCDYLYARLTARVDPPAPAAPPLAPAQAPRAASPDSQELEILGATPFEPAHIEEMLNTALGLLAPLVQANHVVVSTTLPAPLPPVAVQRVPMHHAFLSILQTVLRAAAGGTVTAETHADAGIALLSLTLLAAAPESIIRIEDEQMATAQQLLRLSGGDLAIALSESGVTTVTVTLPTVAGAPVLIVDDNVDALRLFQRYLEGTRYHFFGTSDPEHVLDLAAEVSACVVILDLMLPRVDGWELLSRLREHPATRRIPVLICTILPEEDIALMFGAVALLRKPVSQPELLAALDRALALPKESR